MRNAIFPAAQRLSVGPVILDMKSGAQNMGRVIGASAERGKGVGVSIRRVAEASMLRRVGFTPPMALMVG